MKILAIEIDLINFPMEARDELLKREASALWVLQQSGLVREAYMTDRKTRAVLMLECADLDQARSSLASLPLVNEGYIRFELSVLEPYPGYARLFGR